MIDPTPRAELHLLLVDEHTVVREGLRRVLEGCGEGWTVVEAASGFQALERLREQAFGLVITDLSMPGMHGLELIHRISSVRLKVEQDQLVIGDGWIRLGSIGLQGA